MLYLAQFGPVRVQSQYAVIDAYLAQVGYTAYVEIDGDRHDIASAAELTRRNDAR